MSRTAILDFDAGNLTSVLRAVEHIGHTATVTRDPRVVRDAGRIIFPGVGAAGAAMDSLEQFGLIEDLLAARRQGKPILGICIGCQVIFEHSEEDGGIAGLGMLPGRVVRFRFSEPTLPARGSPAEGLAEPSQPAATGLEIPRSEIPRWKIPHMGWNQVDFAPTENGRHEVFRGIEPGSEFYFVHSYYPQPADRRHVQGATEYGQVRFASAVADDNLVAVQFHAEKSGRAGLRILENFLAWNA